MIGMTINDLLQIKAFFLGFIFCFILFFRKKNKYVEEIKYVPKLYK